VSLSKNDYRLSMFPVGTRIHLHAHHDWWRNGTVVEVGEDVGPRPQVRRVRVQLDDERVSSWMFITNLELGEIDTWSSASRQHYIDTGRYLPSTPDSQEDNNP
jgi:hypothetical protein